MSQHYFNTEVDEVETCVFMGWDEPLQGFFMVIQKPTYVDTPFWSNLEEDHWPHHPWPDNIDGFLNVLNEMGIQLPEKMITELLNDKKNNIGNKQVFY